MFIISLLQLAVTCGFPSFLQLLRSLEKTLRLVLALPHRAAAWPNIALPCGLPGWPRPKKCWEDLKFSPNRIIWGRCHFKVRPIWDPQESFSCFFRHHEIEVLELAWMMCSDSKLFDPLGSQSHMPSQAPIQDQYFLSLPRISVRTSLVGTRTRRRD